MGASSDLPVPTARRRQVAPLGSGLPDLRPRTVELAQVGEPAMAGPTRVTLGVDRVAMAAVRLSATAAVGRRSEFKRGNADSLT